MVPETGIEPVRHFWREILSLIYLFKNQQFSGFLLSKIGAKTDVLATK